VSDLKDSAIQFQATVFKVATTIDGGIRLTLDLNTDPKTMTALIQARQPGIILECVCLAVKPEKQELNRVNGEIPTRSEWQPEGPPEER